LKYSFHVPPGPLGQIVDRIWMCADEPPHARERILPSGTVELVFNLIDDEIRIYDPLKLDRCRRFSGAVVSGPYRTCFAIDPAQHASIMGVHFKPGGAFPFFGAVDELADAHVDLDAFWGRWAGELRARLAAAAPARRFAILERALVARWRQCRRRNPAVAVALETFEESPGLVTIRAAAKRVDLSERQFIQVFSREVGLTPKMYCRIQRFQQAREAVETLTTPNWAALAVDSGYFDQSHLIRDFREFSGFSPTVLASQASERVLTNHVAETR
jgi:methylphosphotriester-DNA--protein-cysteine methyltransferase